MAARKEEGKGEGVSEAVCPGTRHSNSKALLQWPMSFHEPPPPRQSIWLRTTSNHLSFSPTGRLGSNTRACGGHFLSKPYYFNFLYCTVRKEITTRTLHLKMGSM